MTLWIVILRSIAGCKRTQVNWAQSQDDGLRLCEIAAMKCERSCTTVARLRVWEMPLSATSMYSASHVNVGFFQGASLPDPTGLLQGGGKFMRHVKVKPGTATNAAALERLVKAAYSDIKVRVEHG